MRSAVGKLAFTLLALGMLGAAIFGALQRITSNSAFTAVAPAEIETRNGSPQRWEDPNNQLSTRQPALAAQDTASNGEADPYASGQAAIMAERMREGREYVLQTARTAGFAVRCGVIPDYEMGGIIGAAIRSVYHKLGLVAEADQVAILARSNGPDCSYWRNNPDAVADMRDRGLRSVQ